VLHSQDRWGDSLRLLQWGFAHFSYLRPATVGQQVTSVLLPNAGSAPLRVVAAAGGGVPVSLEELPRVRRVVSVRSMRAPVYRGQLVGTLTLWVGGDALRTLPLVAGNTVLPLPWWDQAWRWMWRHI